VFFSEGSHKKKICNLIRIVVPTVDNYRKVVISKLGEFHIYFFEKDFCHYTSPHFFPDVRENMDVIIGIRVLHCRSFVQVASFKRLQQTYISKGEVFRKNTDLFIQTNETI